MVLFTDPRQVTNWLDPIEKNYTEQKRQRELHHSQSKAVWAQQEAATFTAGDFDNILKGLSSFILSTIPHLSIKAISKGMVVFCIWNE